MHRQDRDPPTIAGRIQNNSLSLAPCYLDSGHAALTCLWGVAVLSAPCDGCLQPLLRYSASAR